MDRGTKIDAVVNLAGRTSSWRISDSAYPPARGPMWAKCDMLATVSLARLDRIKVRDPGGKRDYLTFQMPADDLSAILTCIKFALGLVDK